jgi:translation initiation factor IF-2
MSKRVHEIAKERGLAPKEVLAQLQAGGLKVKAVSSSVDEAEARRVLGDGNGAAQSQPSRPVAARSEQPRRDRGGERSQPAARESREPRADRGSSRSSGEDRPASRAESQSQSQSEPQAQPTGDASTHRSDGPAGESGQHKRPTRDSLQGERAPGNAGGRRRVVIDSQASRRNTGGPPGQTNQPPRRQRRGRRRRGIYDEEAESRPSQTALAEPDAIRINSGSTVKDVAEYLSVPVPEIMKKLMALGEMKTLTQTLSDDSIQVLAAELGKDI